MFRKPKIRLYNKMEVFLEPWAQYADVEPDKQSIPSSLVLSLASDDVKSLVEDYKQTNKFLIRHANVTSVPILRHYYLQLGQSVWHPGASDRYNGFRPISDEENKDQVSEIMEMCHFCTYNYLKKCYQKNSKFFLPTNNCELIIGRIEETTAIYLVIIIIIFIVFNGFSLLPIILLFAILFFFLLIRIPAQKVYHNCPHIRLHYDE